MTLHTPRERRPSSVLATVVAIGERVNDALGRFERRCAELVSSPHLRWPARVSFVVFFAYEAFFVSLQRYLPIPRHLQSSYGYALPFRMFAGAPPESWALVAVGITASGERVPIPLHDEIFTHYRGLAQPRAFEEGLWLLGSKVDPAPKQELAEFLRDRMAAWGVEIVAVELKVKVVPNTAGQPAIMEPTDPRRLSPAPAKYDDLGTFPTPPRSPRPPKPE